MTELGEGERREARRRRAFLWTIGTMVVAGMVLGGFLGANAAVEDISLGDAWTALPRPLAIGLIAAATLAFVYGSWRFFRVIDEVEMADNLWASTASYYVYGLMFPLWWALAKVDVLPDPNDWAIYFTALAGGGLIYGWRKWRAR